MRTVERRLVTSSIQVRSGSSKASSPGTISGWAARFNTYSKDLGGFKERLAPGIFTRTLKGNPDVRCLLNHDPNKVLGRTTNGTLTLKQTDSGLAYTCVLPDTTAGRDAFEAILTGVVGDRYGRKRR